MDKYMAGGRNGVWSGGKNCPKYYENRSFFYCFTIAYLAKTPISTDKAVHIF